MRKPCCDKQDTNKGAWSKQEDHKLIHYIQNHGEGNWNALPQAAGLLRCGKSCRLRWINYLRPDLKRGNFAEDEDDLIIKLHALLGNRWSLIAGRLPGRTDNEVKNYWNSHLRRKLISKGIDPNNHRMKKHNPPPPPLPQSPPPPPQTVTSQNKNNNSGDDSEERICKVGELNLNLSLSNFVEERQQNTVPSVTKEKSSPILLLFGKNVQSCGSLVM